MLLSLFSPQIDFLWIEKHETAEMCKWNATKQTLDFNTSTEKLYDLCVIMKRKDCVLLNIMINNYFYTTLKWLSLDRQVNSLILNQICTWKWRILMIHHTVNFKIEPQFYFLSTTLEISFKNINKLEIKYISTFLQTVSERSKETKPRGCYIILFKLWPLFLGSKVRGQKRH